MKVVRCHCGFTKGIDMCADGNKKGMCLACKDELSVTLKSFSSSLITVIDKGSDGTDEWGLTGFYDTIYAFDNCKS